MPAAPGHAAGPPPGATSLAFRAGLAASLPFVPVLLPFGLVFGAVATHAGFGEAQVAVFSLLVMAGASQITAVELLQQQAPFLVILLSALAVNLRMAMYSAALVPWLGRAPLAARAGVAFALVDLTYAVALAGYQAEPRMTMRERLAFFAGTATLLAAPWPAICWVGARLGQAVPAGTGLDYAVPIAFIAMVVPLLRTTPQAVAAALAFGLSLALHRAPAGVGLLAASLAAMVAGALLEAAAERRGRG